MIFDSAISSLLPWSSPSLSNLLIELCRVRRIGSDVEFAGIRYCFASVAWIKTASMYVNELRRSML